MQAALHSIDNVPPASVHFHRAQPEARTPVQARRPRHRQLVRGQVIDGVVKALVNRTDGVRLQVDFGKDETALVSVAGPRGGCVAQ